MRYFEPAILALWHHRNDVNYLNTGEFSNRGQAQFGCGTIILAIHIGLKGTVAELSGDIMLIPKHLQPILCPILTEFESPFRLFPGREAASH